MRRGDPATGQQLLAVSARAWPHRGGRTGYRCDPAAAVVRDFEAFLRSERGLSTATVVSYVTVVRRFLHERFARKALRLEQLRAQELHCFVVREVQRVSRTHGKIVITALRSFMRFLLLRGAVRTDLARTLPGVATWRLSHLPQVAASRTGGATARVLRPRLTKRHARLRDPAAVGPTRLARRRGLEHDLGGSGLGARRDCRAGQGPAAGALAFARGRWCGAGALSLRSPSGVCHTSRICPHGCATAGSCAQSGVCCVVRRALARAGLDPEFKGAHLLRHSLATNLLRRGASLSEIGQLLRHRQPTTTQIYAKVDIAALRGIALPWPGSAS